MKATKPTYTAAEIKRMVSTFELEYETFKTISDIVEEEIDLYSQEELIVLTESSLIMLTRSLLKLSLKNIR